jgi:hypothetical protein
MGRAWKNMVPVGVVTSSIVEFSAIRFEIYSRRYLKDGSIVSFRLVDRDRSLTSEWSNWIPTSDYEEKTPLYRWALARCLRDMGYLPAGRG